MRGTVTYFMQRGSDGPIKIGKTSNIPRRIAAIQNGCAEPVSLVGWIAGDLESDLHRKFSHLRMAGEWFSNDGEILGYVRSFCDVNTRDCVVRISRTVCQALEPAANELVDLLTEYAASGKSLPHVKRLFDSLQLLKSAVHRVDLESGDRWIAEGCQPVSEGAAR